MYEIGASTVEPEPISENLLVADPIKYGNMLYGVLHIAPWNRNFQTISQDNEVRAVCVFCSQFNDFINNAFDELSENIAQPGRAKTLWDAVTKEEFNLATLVALNLNYEDMPHLVKEKKERQRAIAHLYELDKQAIAIVNEILQQNIHPYKKTA